MRDFKWVEVTQSQHQRFVAPYEKRESGPSCSTYAVDDKLPLGDNAIAKYVPLPERAWYIASDRLPKPKHWIHDPWIQAGIFVLVIILILIGGLYI